METNGSISLLTGTVGYYDYNRGFGFIRCEEFTEDVFVHHAHIEGGGGKLYLHQIVNFDAVQTSKGLSAINVVGIRKGVMDA